VRGSATFSAGLDKNILGTDMGKATGFLEIDRQDQKYLPAADRIRHYREFTLPLDDKDVGKQAARCMDCGVPYCHGPTGCPVNNQIPDWNDLVYRDEWENAIVNLHSTNNFPEFTGRTQPISQARSMIAHSIVLIATGVSSRFSVQASSHGAGQTRPVNSGKLLVECRLRIASSQLPL